MRIAFRQGLIAFQKDAGNPVFLQQSMTSGFVDHIISPTSTIVTFAHGSSDYLQSFDDTVTAAWGPVVSGVDNYLYFDIDLLTSNVSRGITTLIPISSLTEPVSPADGQHWFDLNTTTMKVWSTARSKWQPKVRVFAGRVVNGNTNTIVMFSEGSQVGLVGPSNPGYIMLDTQLQPLRKSSGEFLTDDTAVHVRSTVGTAGVLVQPANRVVPVRAGESIPAMSLVYFSAPDTVRLASSNPALMPARIPVGVITEALASGDVGTLAPFGEITWDQWPLQPGPLGADFGANAGAPLYCGFNGEITLVRPEGLLAYRVGFVKNATTIMFGVDAETYPQVYQANVNSLVISGVPPVAITDTINGLGERTVTIGVPNATALAAGLMTAAQFIQLGNHETRISTAEGDISTLQTSKADVIHTHVIGDVTGLQGDLDTLTNSLAAKADKVTGAVAGNFAGLDVNGNLTDSGFSSTNFSLIGHTHTIPDVTGLQTAIDNKANRSHLNSFAEVFQGVDRTGPTDLGTGLDLNAVLLTKSDVGHTHVIADTTGLQLALNGKSDIGHAHAIADVTGLQGELDNRAFVSHTHTIGNVTGLQLALDGKSDIGHGHAIADVTGLQLALDGKSDIGHGHAIADVTGLQLALDGKSDIGHGHAIADVTGLQLALDGKSDTGHGHVIADVTGLQLALDGKSDTGHGHVIADVTGLQLALDGKIGFTNTTVYTPSADYHPASKKYVDDNAFVIGSIDQHTDVDTVTNAPAIGDLLVWDGTNWVPSAPAVTLPAFEEYVATAGQTVVNTVAPTTSNGDGLAHMQVFVNGVFQMEGATKAYTVTGATQITFNTGLALNDDIAIHFFA